MANLRRQRDYFDVCDKQQSNKRNMIREKMQLVNEYARSIGLQVYSVNLCPFVTIEEVIPIKIVVSMETTNDENEKKFHIFKTLMAKDFANISNKKYKIVRKYLNHFNLPGLNKIIFLQNKINKFFIIYKNNYGAYCNVEQKIKFVCQKLLEDGCCVGHNVD